MNKREGKKKKSNCSCSSLYVCWKRSGAYVSDVLPKSRVRLRPGEPVLERESGEDARDFLEGDAAFLDDVVEEDCWPCLRLD